MIIAVVITTAINTGYIICFLSLCCKKKMQKHLCLGRLLDSEITPLLSGSLTFLALPQSTCKINAVLFIKDNVPTVFVFTKHLQRSATSLPVLILLYRGANRGPERLIGLLRVTH